MKFNQYRCDNCKGEDNDPLKFTGVNPLMDLFTHENSFPLIDATKADIHICVECFRLHCEVPTINELGLNKQARAWQLRYQERSYLLRNQVVKALKVADLKRPKK